MDMHKELFKVALGISEPIFIERIEFVNGELHIRLDFKKGGKFPCPTCGQACTAYDKQYKSWQHLNFFQYKCFLHFGSPRTNCPDCGVLQFIPDWAREGSGFTLLFEALVVTLIKGGMPYLELERITGVYDNRLRRIVDYYVEKSYSEKDLSEVTDIGIDETSSKKGHKYITVVSDHGKKEVIYVTEGKDAKTIEKFAEELPKHGGDVENITNVTMDMSKAFISGAADHLPNAQVTFDKFHVVKLLNDAVDKVRRMEVKQNPLLKGTKYLWLKNPKQLTLSQLEQIKTLENENLESAKAYRLKLTFQDIYNGSFSADDAEMLLDSWLKLADESGLEPLQEFASTVRAHYEGVLRYFNSRITSGICEGLNSIIGEIKRVARGYRNMRNFINMIYLRKGGLSLPDFVAAANLMK